MGGQLCRQICNRPSESSDAAEASAGKVQVTARELPKLLTVPSPEERKVLYAKAQEAAVSIETTPAASKAKAWAVCEKLWSDVIEIDAALQTQETNKYQETQDVIAAVECAPSGQRSAAWQRCEQVWAAALASSNS
eukprot:gb/GFBE01040877.1/.p1 GENE.gb/GFBE01040877.1/~~gb/GFBE01040877.1/.p1  ORF type:complete len:136 (+),score=32.49 gb/GFBE01040877.1/:1-408(+)